MPEITIEIGGRSFSVACQEGEEHFLRAAARLLDAEAQAIGSQIGRLPESRMLLMAGLMLADKTAGLEEDLRASEARLAQQEKLIDEMRNLPRPAPQRIEVPVVPPALHDSLAEMAARAEALAEQIEDRPVPN